MKTIVTIAALLAIPGSSAFAGAAPPSPSLGSASASAAGWLGGGRLGYNWQRGSFVYGLEGDVSLTNLNSSMTTILPVRFPFIPNPTAMTKRKDRTGDGTVSRPARLDCGSGAVLWHRRRRLRQRQELNSAVTTDGASLAAQAWSAQGRLGRGRRHRIHGASGRDLQRQLPVCGPRTRQRELLGNDYWPHPVQGRAAEAARNFKRSPPA